MYEKGSCVLTAEICVVPWMGDLQVFSSEDVRPLGTAGVIGHPEHLQNFTELKIPTLGIETTCDYPMSFSNILFLSHIIFLMPGLSRVLE